jgi:hypothetical protein
MLPWEKNYWLLLILALVGCSGLGELLRAYHVPGWVWIVTEMVMLHLAWAGKEAIALAVTWTISLIWTGAFYKSWFYQIPWAGITAWAVALAGSWLLALLVIMLLTLAHDRLKNHDWSRQQTFWALLAIANLGFAAGIVFSVTSI